MNSCAHINKSLK